MQSNRLNSTAILYLFISVVIAHFLHRDFLPNWELVLVGVILGWRYSIFKGKINQPSAWVKLLLVCGGFYGIYYTYGFALSIESAVALLVTSLALKPLEVQTKRDSYVLIFLCILVQGQHFLFEQGPLAYLFVLVSLFSTLCALVVVNQSSQSNAQITTASKIFLLSIPLTVLLFFILPRLSPLWSVNMTTKAGLVGLSDSMSPGDISELGRSDELAFRVSFNNKIPPVNQRYWRALVLDNYDGEKWRANYRPKKNWPAKASDMKSFDPEFSYDYEVITEAHEEKWLFALEGSKPRQKDIAVQDDGLLINRFKAISKFQYKAEAPVFNQTSGAGLENIQAYFSFNEKSTLSALQKKVYLQLPKGLNKRTKELAVKLANDSEGDLEFVKSLADYYLSNPFSYTLSPGEARSDDRVDEFLFDKKIGFCAHYAGSAVYLLRSAGIPARVVLGYLGGERNPVGDYYSVYQYDAHAWVEVWIKHRGWLRIDPTGWVSPERVEMGIEQAINDEFVGFKSQFKWLNKMRHQFQAFNYLWNDLMLGYKDDSQQAILDSFFGNRDSLTWGFIISGLMIAIMALVFLVVMMAGGSSKQSVHYRLLANYVYRLNKIGLDVNTSMSFIEIEKAVVLKYPQAAYGVSLITAHLNQALYANITSDLDKEIRAKYKKIMLRVLKNCR
jgi:transglutaminase-like putative cysteine protease